MKRTLKDCDKAAEMYAARSSRWLLVVVGLIFKGPATEFDHAPVSIRAIQIELGIYFFLLLFWGRSQGWGLDLQELGGECERGASHEISK